MFTKTKHIDELDVPPAVASSKNSHELLRAWTVDGHKMVIQRQNGWEEPYIWGLFLTDMARHIAKSMSDDDPVRENEILERIVAGFEAELRHSDKSKLS